MFKILLEEIPVIEHFSLSSFYSVLRVMKIMEGSELNIEAAAFFRNILLLFNSRKSVIFRIDFPYFFSAIKNGTPLPQVEAISIDLPKLNGIEAGFSGAIFTASGRLLVTDSVEDTDNAYDDGEVLGSFIGVSSGSKNGIFEEFLWTAITSEAPLKIESICVLEGTSAKEISVAMVTDSDGDESLILSGIISL